MLDTVNVLGVDTVFCVEVIDNLFSPNNEFASWFSRMSSQVGIPVYINKSFTHFMSLAYLDISVSAQKIQKIR